MKLEAEEIFELHVLCEESIVVGKNEEGILRVIPIIGGTFKGKLNGTVVSGGADWNTEYETGSHVFAKYLLETEDGEYIAVENEGYWGERVTEICTVPKFTVQDNEKLGWLNTGVYVASLKSGNIRGEIVIVVYRMK